MMDFVTENPLLSLGISAVIVLSLCAAITIHFILKKGFYISANCWFCNQNSRILYSKRNSFVCKLCCQYNGFAKDGGYNKVIKAQYEFSKFITDKTATPTPHILSNGLCSTCNRNHELKVTQLAQFEPINYRNYDKEIRHFEKQLEKTYGLCELCSQTVEKTIREQNKWIFGNKLQNAKNFKLVTSQDNNKFSLSAINIFLFGLSFLNVLILCDFDAFLPDKCTLPSNVIFSDLCLSINNITSEYLGPNILSKTEKIQYLEILSALGFIIELFLSIFTRISSLRNFNQVLTWLILILIPSTDPKNNYTEYLEYLEIVISLGLTYSYAGTCIKRNKPTKLSYSNSLNNSNSTASQNNSNLNQTNASTLPMGSAPANSINNDSIIDRPVPNQLPQQSPTLNMSFASARSNSNNTIFNDADSTTDANHMNFNSSINNGFKSPSELNTSFNELKIGSPVKEREIYQNPFKTLDPWSYSPTQMPPNSRLFFNSDNHAFPFINRNPRGAPINWEPLFATSLFQQETSSWFINNNHKRLNGCSPEYNFADVTSSTGSRQERLMSRLRSQNSSRSGDSFD